eukprot:GHVU01073265.1.p1 GENE.GHVU01073265.1~~GHVU01073265.1.p1  ORF type:complete len:122 (-),score=4.03 GHVU01073265.1:416-781(-)
MHVCVCMDVYACTSVWGSTRACVCLQVCTHLCMWVCVREDERSEAASTQQFGRLRKKDIGIQETPIQHESHHTFWNRVLTLYSNRGYTRRTLGGSCHNHLPLGYTLCGSRCDRSVDVLFFS